MSDSSDRLLRIEVIDAISNRAATGMRVDVFTLGARARKICGGVVDAHGVVEAPVLAVEPLACGEYEVVFHIGEYFRGRGVADATSPHLDTVPFRFATTDEEGYVLPVRVSPREFMLAAP
jgi:5-hydroxyisourate hydrolase-like protein (transthyretin family)